MNPSPQLQTLKAQFFRALAHPVRIRLLEVLVSSGETSVQDLQRTLGIEQPIVSQQLARLRASGIVVARKQRSATFYAAADPLLGDLLRVAKAILNRHLVGVQGLLHELKQDRLMPAASRARRSAHGANR
jgi:DNA-binding transcriptional ArsR family regulator